MPISAKTSGSANRRLLSFFTCVALSGICGSASAQAVPQLLPYTVGVVAGGGTYGVATNKYTVGNYCGTNTSSPPSGTAPLPLAAWPKALSTVGDGCLATQVAITSPNAAAADSEGNVFVVDYTNKLIRRVDAHTGIITTVAGATTTATITPPASDPGAGSACPYGGQTSTDAWGDGCLATSVLMDNPQAIALDAAGNIWFTDYALGAVREVNKSTGILSTVVNTAFTPGYNADNVAYTKTGISAANGKLYRPNGLTFDRNGNLYIADNYNNLVDVVNLGSISATIAGYTVRAGEIFTIAGSGCPYTTSPGCTTASYYGKTPAAGASVISTSAMLDSPYQVAVDNSGNIYIADEYNYDVRVINGTTGMLSTFANNSFTRMTSLTRGVALTTALGSTYGVASDSLGNVYISSYLATSPNWANYVARVDIATGEIFAVGGQLATAVPTAGTAQTGATYCSAKTDAIGDGCPATQATFWKPYQPFVDAAGNVYITDAGDNLIREIAIGTQFPATTTGTPVTQKLEIHFGAGDSPASTSAYSLPTGFTEFTLGTAVCTTNSDTTKDCVLPVTFTPSTAGIRTAPLTVLSSAGLVSGFALTGTGLAPILALDPGTQSTLASTGLVSVQGIALDAAGNVYAAVPGSSSIVKITSAGAESSVGSGLPNANAVAVDAAGNVYAALSSGKVYEVPGNGGSQIALGSFTDPSGIAADSFGNLYVADASADTVSEILAGTGVQVVLASTATVPTLSGPTGVAVDSYGNVFVANTVANTVIEIPFNRSAAVTLGSGLDAPAGLAVDPAGSLYIADSRNSRIVFIPNEDGTLNTSDQIAIITGLGTPSGVSIAGGGVVYVADSFANTISTFTRNSATLNFGNALTAIGNLPATTLTGAADIISMGTQPATFSSTFAAAGGTNPADFSLSPSSIPSNSYFPAAGFGVAQTASFTPSALGSRSATYTFGATNVPAPTLTLNGKGIQPHDTTTTTITWTTPSGSLTYGQTVTVNVNVTVASGLPTPTGNVSVVIDGGSPVAATLNSSGVVSVSVPALSAGVHSISASYAGDTESSSSQATLNLTLATAPLTVTVNNLSKAFDAPLPVLTGTLAGLFNNDQIGVTYSTTATAASAAGTYPITALVSGSAVQNYTVTYVNGTLTVGKDSSVTGVSASATSVNSTTQVILSANVANQTSYAIVSIPTGSVTFLNTVGSNTTQIGTAPLNSSGVATLTTSFAVTGATTTNSVTAVYSGDSNFLSSTSAGLSVVSGIPTFALTPAANSSLTVAPGQSGLMSFTLVPAFGYNGTIGFSCTAPSASVTCSFSPSTIVENGSSTSSLIAVTINSQQATSSLSTHQRPAIGSGGIPLSLAALPGLALLFGFSRLRRNFLRGYRSLLFVALCLLGIGFSGCSGSHALIGTPAGSQTVTIVASGTGGSFSSVTQQFMVTLNVQ